jgi:hypothetical protein
MNNLDTIEIDWIFREDADFDLSLWIRNHLDQPEDMSGYTWVAAVAARQGIAPYLTTAGGHIIVTGSAAGEVKIRISKANINAHAETQKSAWMTVTATKSGTTSVLLEGQVSYSRSSI